MTVFAGVPPTLSVSTTSDGVAGRLLDRTMGCVRAMTPNDSPTRRVDGALSDLLSRVRFDLGISGPLAVRLEVKGNQKELFAGYLERSSDTGALSLTSFEAPSIGDAASGKPTVLPVKMAPPNSSLHVHRVTALVAVQPFRGDQTSAWMTVFDSALQVSGGVGLERLRALAGRTVEIESYVSEDGPGDARTSFGRVGITEDGDVALFDPLDRTKRPLVFRELHTISNIALATLPAYWDANLGAQHLAGSGVEAGLSALFQWGTKITVRCCPRSGSASEVLQGEFREVVTGRDGEKLLTIHDGRFFSAIPLSQVQSVHVGSATKDSFVSLLKAAKEDRAAPDSGQKRLSPLPYETTVSLGKFR